MTSSFELVLNEASAQDLFFIEQDVPDTKVVEKRTEAGTTSFNMPGVIEAVILITAVGAVTSAIAWILKDRSVGEGKMTKINPDGTTTTYEFKWNESTTSEQVIKGIEAWLSVTPDVFGNIGGN